MDYLAKFHHYLNASRFSPNTIRSYSSDLAQFLEYLSKEFFNEYPSDEIPLEAIDSHQIEVYFQDRKFAGELAEYTIRRNLSAMRTFFHFYIAEKELEANPALEVCHPFIKSWEPKSILLIEEIEELISMPTTRKPWGYHYFRIRDRAIMDLLYWTGVQVGELTGMEADAFIPADGSLRIKNPEDDVRTFKLRPSTESILAEYLTIRDHLEGGKGLSENRLFLSRTGHSLVERDIQRIVEKYAKALFPWFSVSPKTLRHSRIAHMLEDGFSEEDIMESFGLKSRTSIRGHLARIAEMELQIKAPLKTGEECYVIHRNKNTASKREPIKHDYLELIAKSKQSAAEITKE